MKLSSFAITAATVFALTQLFACEEVGNTVDCFRICDRYSECMTDIDVTSCTDTCEDRADEDEAVETDLKQCEACVDNGSCAEV
jgi:hypothetical protein